MTPASLISWGKLPIIHHIKYDSDKRGLNYHFLLLHSKVLQKCRAHLLLIYFYMEVDKVSNTAWKWRLCSPSKKPFVRNVTVCQYKVISYTQLFCHLHYLYDRQACQQRKPSSIRNHSLAHRSSLKTYKLYHNCITTGQQKLIYIKRISRRMFKLLKKSCRCSSKKKQIYTCILQNQIHTWTNS